MLTQAQIDFFHENGYLIMRGLIRGRELEELTQAADEVQRQGIAREGEGHRYAYFNETEKVYWRSENMWKRGDIFLAVTVNPVLLENIGQCIGDSFKPYNDSLVVKLPHQGAPVRWHQDPPFGDARFTRGTARPNFTTDIYLDHSDEHNGCVYAIPGHHMVGHVELASKAEEELFEHYGAVPIRMEPGDVLFHCVSTPHGSGANTSDRQRRIFYIHYMSEASRRECYTSLDQFISREQDFVELADSMLAARSRLDLDGIDDRGAGTLEYSPTGFRFTGTPVSPVDLWQRCVAAMPVEEVAAKKKLLKLSERISG